METPGRFADGVEYTSCRLNVPACQPSRVGFLTGQYAQRNGVYGTSQYLSDPSNTIGPWMQAAGYSTGMIGKYPYPFGWQKLSGWTVQRTLVGEGNAYGYGVFDGTNTTYPSEHQTTHLFEEGVSFVSSAPRPWFCWMTPTDPHVPLVPRPQDVGDWQDVEWRLPDDDMVGKPSWMQSQPSLNDDVRASIRGQARLQLEELNAVDDGVDAISTRCWPRTSSTTPS